MLYSGAEKKLSADTHQHLEEGIGESLVARRRFNRISTNNHQDSYDSFRPSFSTCISHHRFSYRASICSLFLFFTTFLRTLMLHEYPTRDEQNNHQKVSKQQQQRYNILHYLVLFLSFQFHLIACYGLSSVASNYRRTMLLQSSAYRIVQLLNFLSFCASFVSVFVLFAVLVFLLQQHSAQLDKWKKTLLSSLIGAEHWSIFLLFLSCLYFTLATNHSRMEKNGYLGFVAFLSGCLSAAILLHKAIFVALWRNNSSSEHIISSTNWRPLLISVFHIFGYITILFQSILVWEGNLSESWLLLPISSWYDTHDSFHYHSKIQQIGSLLLSLLTTCLLETMKVALLLRWQIYFVMKSSFARLANRMTHRSPVILAQLLFYRCLVIASWMGCSVLLSLTLATGDFISIISDYPFALSWSSLCSVMTFYLSHWVTMILYAVLVSAYLILPSTSIGTSLPHQKWSKFKWTCVLLCILIGNHPTSRYFLLGWFPNIFSSYEELTWITTQFIPMSYLLFILYIESKPFIYLFLTTRRSILLPL